MTAVILWISFQSVLISLALCLASYHHRTFCYQRIQNEIPVYYAALDLATLFLQKNLI